MKKALLAGAALMLIGGLADTASAATEPGVKITGNARVRFYYKSEEYRNYFGNPTNALQNPDSTFTQDSRVRFDLTGTAAGGAYAKARIRLMENRLSDLDRDGGSVAGLGQDNIWVDKAYIGIPFNDMFTLELGKYRATYGPLPVTYNFFYDDVHLAGALGIIKTGDIVINPFIEWMDNGEDSGVAIDNREDNDEVRLGVHLKGKVNKDWTLGGMLGYQTDAREESNPGFYTTTSVNDNSGWFASFFVNGKVDQFGLVGEIAVTDNELNGFNSWLDDSNTASVSNRSYYRPTPTTLAQTPNVLDTIGSDDTGWGGYIFPNYTIDKLNIGLNLGFTTGGFLADNAFGFVMVGAADNSVITAGHPVGWGGDWFWAGLVANYKINDSLKLTGNLVYVDVDPWTESGEGPGFVAYNNMLMMDSAWEISALLQYTISKGMDVYFAAGYLDPSLEYINVTQVNSGFEEDGVFGAYTRFELSF